MLKAHSLVNIRLWARGVDTDLFTPERRSLRLRTAWTNTPTQVEESNSEKVIITYVGRVSTEKNINLLIEAFSGLNEFVEKAQAAHPGCKLVIIGDGPARSNLEKQTAGMDIQFLGYRKGQDLADCYASSDIFAFPSHSETFGNVVLEALASGLPAVILKAEGVSDLVEDNQTGKPGVPPLPETLLTSA